MSKPIMSAVPNTVTRTLVCIDALADYDFLGTLYNPYMPKPVCFARINDLIGAMEGFFNAISYPQSSFADRSFLQDKSEMLECVPEPVHQHMDEAVLEQNHGELVTFEIRVRHRHNATWQGDITWREKDKTAFFRSILEMIKLMDLAVTETLQG